MWVTCRGQQGAYWIRSRASSSVVDVVERFDDCGDSGFVVAISCPIKNIFSAKCHHGN